MDFSENVYQKKGSHSTPNLHYLGVFQYVTHPLPLEIEKEKDIWVMTF